MLRDAERRTRQAGHENEGFLSTSRGFLPQLAPLERLSPAFAAWDQLAAELPHLYQDLSLRRRAAQLPLLDASEASLDDEYLLRACALMSIVAQAYWHVEVSPPERLPDALAKPWAQLRRRLGRQQEVLTYVDLIVYNWRLVDPNLPDPFRVDNLRLLIPTVDNREERVFYLTQLEMLAHCSPLVQLVTQAQDAVLGEDKDSLEEALLGVIRCLENIVGVSLPKINPHPHGATHVDPIVWAKTVAPFAVPMRAGDQGPSGTSSPIFNTLDLFFGRRDYESFLGREIQQLRATYPLHWRSFLKAITRVPIADYVERAGSSTLRGAWREAFELYVGPNGFLGRHRMKVYGFLELAFKVGRSVTIGGFGGVFKDRTWDQVDNELEAARKERLRRLPSGFRQARVEPVASAVASSAVRHVTLDISKAGVRYGAGDRCAIYPENAPALIERTLAALGARGDEPISLTDEWRAAGAVRPELVGKTQLPIRDVLRLASIRPVIPRVAEALHARTQSAWLLDQIRRRCTERFELWELLERLHADGLDPVQLWKGPGAAAGAALCCILPPERFRLYSIASSSPSPLGKPAPSVDLVVGHLTYSAPAAAPEAAERCPRGPAATGARPAIAEAPSAASRPTPSASPVPPPGCPLHDPARLAELSRREGTASSFLVRAQRDNATVAFHFERPAVFQPPRDPHTPIIFFGGGTGVSPFLGFVQERLRTPASAPAWLLWSMRSRQDFICGRELEPALAAGLLELDVCFTREEARVAFDVAAGLQVRPGVSRRIEDVMLEAETAERLWRWIEPETGPGAALYVCGRSGFARSVLDALGQIFERFSTGTGAERKARAAERVSRLVANQRLLFEVHTDAQPAVEEPRWIDVSDVAEHNDEAAGYWMVIDRAVYDVSELVRLHPGGRSVIEAYAGTDASHGYARAHHQRAEVDAMREMYRIGMLRELELDDRTAEIESPSGPLTVTCRSAHHAWVQALQLCVEMENALRSDYSLARRPALLGEDLGAPGPYKLMRGVETHARFLRFYRDVLEEETLPGLWRITQGLFAPDQCPGWMEREVARVRSSAEALAVEHLAARLQTEHGAFAGDVTALRRVVGALERADLALLAELKRALLGGVRVFERHERRARLCGARELRSACAELPEIFERADRALASELAAFAPCCAEPPAPAATSAETGARPHRLYTSSHWILDDRPDKNLTLLQRTPAAWGCLGQLRAESDAILRSLGDDLRGRGLLVDLRHAPIRNDPGFEAAMARLREGLTGHFERTAVLLETNLGELQVTRIERDERRNTFTTCSESAALKFLSGGR